MFGAYVRENRKVVIALAVYTAVFAFIFWLYRLPLGAVGYAALVCLFLLLVWLAVDYRRFAVRLRLLRRLEQEITLSTEQLPEPDGALDSRATDELLRLFEDVNRGGQTTLMVTHSVKAASHASRVLFIKDGEVFHEIYRGESSDEQLYQKISDTLTMLATGGVHHA